MRKFMGKVVIAPVLMAVLVATCGYATESGRIIGWGDNSFGQGALPGGNDFMAIAAGGNHSLALKSDGSVIGWGDNRGGQATPPVGNDFVAVAAGWHHSMALKADGLIVSWGWDSYGQGTPPEGNDFVAVEGGFGHSLALKGDGSIVGWGWDFYGQVTPPDGNDFIAVAAGNVHSLALKPDGSIVAWGYNEQGQCDVPLPNAGFVAIAAGGYHSVAIQREFVEVDGVSVVEKERLGRRVFRYVCTLSFRNTVDLALSNVKAELAEAPSNVTVIDGFAGCSYIEPNGTAVSEDTFEIEVDRSVLIEPTEMVWNISYEIGEGGQEMQGTSSLSVFLESVDIEDLARLVEAWLWEGEPGGIAEDISPDGRVDFADLAELGVNW